MKIPTQYISQIEQTFRKVKPTNIQTYGACLVWTFSVLAVLEANKIRAVLQAETCMWPRIRPEQDDGVCSTHFGYQWSPNTYESRIAVMTGHMPEIHIWAAIPKTQTIIDFSTREFPKACKKIIKADWPGDLPPKYLWCAVKDLPKNVLYKPEIGAIQYASIAIEKFINEDLHKPRREN
jgi:hypothetical protein